MKVKALFASLLLLSIASLASAATATFVVNAATTGDTASAVPFPRFQLKSVTITGASANLAASTAMVGVNTLSGTVATLASLSPLTSPSATLSLAVPSPNAVLLGRRDVLRIHIDQGASPVAVTVQVTIEVQAVP